jgi:Fibrobacter succinogenes major domain (Fib_succ_major)
MLSFRLVALLLLSTPTLVLAQVGIGTNSPNASAQLDVTSTAKGFLPPRMTTYQRDAISSPALGLVIFNTTTNCLNFFMGNGWHETCGTPTYRAGSVFCAGQTAVVNVTNPSTGRIWMDRNLGATQAATSSTDASSFGDLYQWGRRSDGHQCRNSPITETLSSVDQPGNGNFILVASDFFDWRTPQNNNLWQGWNGVNNPCPSGYRIPTQSELNSERLSWSSNNSDGGIASPLKWPLPGNRNLSSGSILDVSSGGYYWSSSLNGSYARYLFLYSSVASINDIFRAQGFSVRCIKD